MNVKNAIFLRRVLGIFRKCACRYPAILTELKRHEYLCPSPLKWPLPAVSHLSVAFVCLPSLVADCDLVAVNCRCIRFPRVGSGRQGWGISLTVSYLVLSWLMVQFLLRHYSIILISRQKKPYWLSNIWAAVPHTVN